jgi:ABC-2 type transport system ATP-binding protein
MSVTEYRQRDPLLRPAPTGVAVRTVDLTKEYGGRRVVDAVNLELPTGVISGFVGPNGAGKTTTIRMLLGLVTPTSGHGQVLDQPLSRPAGYLPQVGAMIEGPAFMPALSGRENLRALAAAGGLPGSRVDVALERVGLGERGRDLFRKYSLGMKQRLGLAAALLPEPELLVLDEPTNGLDPAGIMQMRDLLASLRDDGMTIFVSSHLLSELEQIAEHLVIIRQGALVFQGPLVQLVQAQQPELRVEPEDVRDRDLVADIASALDWPADVVTGQVRVQLPAHLPDGEQRRRAAELNRRSHDAGVNLARLEIHRPSLEDAFFELTGTSSGDVH